MARVGVSKAMVERARDALMARGEHPSIDAVRIELGNTGSKTTLHRYLRELAETPTGEGTTTLSAPLARLVEQLAAQLQAEGRARIDAAEAGLRAQLTQLQGQLAARDRQLGALEAKHQEACAALEHYRVASGDQREQREQEQRRVQTQVRQLQGQLQTLQQGALARDEEATRLHRDNAKLLAEQRQATAQLRLLEQQLEQRDAQVQGLRAMLAQVQGASDEIRRQLAAKA
ncbi:DNA-binding protein [Pseudomonas sp. UFMG81]|jgi:hypothetical protein|uniref:DNA-binding protein n=1 Tax=Pseudomonas sp. UFMG81 TaxID=2745936 RepID=UPI0018907616|nr:DNA-binding protein [Pseudomonas sp. UFMG81]